MTRVPTKLVLRFINLQGRIALAALVALAVYLLTIPLETALRIALAYDVGVTTFLVLYAYRINQITARDLQDYYQDREPSNHIVMITAVLFSTLSLAGVGSMADVSAFTSPVHQHLHTAASLLAIVLSWILLHVFYAFYYAHKYYDVDESRPDRPLKKGLEFPNDEAPDYWDFFYYSFTIAMCYQTSDVTVCNRSMRRITLFHAVISFLYVTAILGLVINLLSNEI